MRELVVALMAGLAIAAATNNATSQPAQPYMPSLVEFMINVQSHHAKLWLASIARNWDLADYQVDELKELLEDIAKRVPDYKGTPVGKMIESITMPPIGEIESAIKARDSAKFTAAFDQLTAACNACHEAANRGFIVIRRPATSPFPNQSFAPRGK
jgi:Spy/CpxP family protein refolding chaperone